MRTAEEILNKNHYTRQDPECDMDGLIKIINEARIEAINECAKSATPDFNANRYHNKFQVDSKSILKLIDQVK